MNVVWYNGYRRKITDTEPRVQNLHEAVCISLKANAFGNGMNPTIFPASMSK